MNAIQQIVKALSGYKTYIVSLFAILYAAGIHFGWWPHSADVDLLFGGAGAMTLRAAIAKLCAQLAADPRFKLAIAAIALFLIMSPARAGVETPFDQQAPDTKNIQQVLENEVGKIAAAHEFEVAVYPTYARGLDRAWGFGGAVLHPIGKYAFAGLRFDAFDNQYFAASAGVGGKYDFTIRKFDVEVFAITGAGAPVAGGGNKNLNVSAIAGTGGSIEVLKNSQHTLSLSIFGAAEYWSDYDKVVFLHAGAVAKVKF